MGCAVLPLLASSRRARGRHYCRCLNFTDPSRLELGPLHLEHCLGRRGVWNCLLLPICGRVPACITKLHHTHQRCRFFLSSLLMSRQCCRSLDGSWVGASLRVRNSFTFSFQRSKCLTSVNRLFVNLQLLEMQ